MIEEWYATEPSLRSLLLPVLPFAAEHDFITRRALEGWQHLGHLLLEVIPGAAHHALLEQPDIYRACLEQFLGEHEDSSPLPRE